MNRESTVQRGSVRTFAVKGSGRRLSGHLEIRNGLGALFGGGVASTIGRLLVREYPPPPRNHRPPLVCTSRNISTFANLLRIADQNPKLYLSCTMPPECEASLLRGDDLAAMRRETSGRERRDRRDRRGERQGAPVDAADDTRDHVGRPWTETARMVEWMGPIERADARGMPPMCVLPEMMLGQDAELDRRGHQPACERGGGHGRGRRVRRGGVPPRGGAPKP